MVQLPAPMLDPNSIMSLKRGIFYTLVMQAPTLLLYFVASMLMTRMLGDVGRGEYALITNHVALLAMVIGLNLGYGLTFFTSKASGDPLAVVGVAACFLLVNMFLTPLLLWCISLSDIMSGVLMPPERTHWGYWAFIYLSVMLGLVNTSIGAVLLGLKKFRTLNWMSLLNAALSAAGLLILFNLRDRVEPDGLLPMVLIVSAIAMLLQCLAWCAVYAIQIHIIPRPVWAWAIVKPILTFSIVGHLSNLINLINYRFDVWVVDYYHGAAELGLYAVAVGVGQLLFNVPEPFSRVVQPFLFGQVKDEMISRFKAIARLNFTTLTLLAILLGTTAPWIIPLLFGEVFLPSVTPLCLLLPGIVFSGVSKLLAQLVVQGSLQRFNLYATSIAALVTICLDMFLIPRYGIEGAAIASTLSYLSVLAIILLTIRFRSGIAVHDVFLLRPSDIRQIGQSIRSTARP